MARPTREERLGRVHAEALKQFDRIQSAVKDERQQCLADRRFYAIAGAQWEGRLGDQFENKPRLEVNKILLAVIRIFNEYRNNRITVDFVAKDGDDAEGLDDVCDKLYRADEQESVAQEAYDNAFEEAVGGGFGAFRLRAEYEDDTDDENERQKICIEPIYDADCCAFFDLDAKRQDKSDAKHCFVLYSVTREAFGEEWGDDRLSDMPKAIQHVEFDWTTADIVYLAEYYVKEEQSYVVYVYQGLDGQEERVTDDDIDGDELLLARLEATGFTKVREKKARRQRVHKYLLSGAEVLDDCGCIAGSEIPIVPVYGKRWVIDGVERCMGHVRPAKDIARLKNMMVSKLAEISAMHSYRKPIFTPEQIAGHQTRWAEDNVKNYPYLLINPIVDANGQPTPVGPVAYTESPDVPQALAALLQITEQDIQDVLGNQQQAEEVQPNLSGKAIELVQQRLDMQTYIYMDNMSKSVKRAGEIWLSMAKDVYVEEGRKMRGVASNDAVEQIELMKPRVSKTGEVVYDADLSRAKFRVHVDVGPSSDSKRQAIVRALTGMMTLTQDPETLQVLSAMALMNLEGEGIQDVRDYFRQKLLRMGAVKPTEEEAKQLAAEAQNQQPDPQSQYLLAAAEQAQSEGAKARADTIRTVAQAEESRAKAAKLLSEIDQTKAATAKTLSDIGRQEREALVQGTP